MLLIYILTSVCIAYIFNRNIANIPWIPNVACFVEWLVNFLQKHLWNRNDASIKQKISGIICIIFAMLIAIVVPTVLIFMTFFLFHGVDWLIHTLVCYQILNLRHIRDKARRVYNALLNEELKEAQYELSKFIEVDVSNLNREEIINDTVSAIAVKSTGEVVSPLFFMCIGGAPLACLHKVVWVMAEKFGSQCLEYQYFGMAATKVNNFLNWLPARVNALCLIYSTYLLGYSMKSARRIFKRDHNKNGINSGYSQSVIAGALNIKLGGRRNYRGTIVNLPFIGDDIQSLNCEDIVKTGEMMYASSILCAVLFFAMTWILFKGL